MLVPVLFRSHPAEEAVGPLPLIVPSPPFKAVPGASQGHKSVLVQALVTDLAVKTLDMAVVHGFAGTVNSSRTPCSNMGIGGITPAMKFEQAA